MIDPKASPNSTVYKVRNAAGEVIAQHVRIDLPGGGKKVWWEQPDGTPNLNGTPLEALPLYGVHELKDDPTLTVVVEGEKARDALADALKGTNVCVVATVTGASKVPSPQTLEPIRGHEVVLWPDTDEAGKQHMEKVAEQLQGVAEMVRLYTWHEAPEVWIEGKDGKPKLKAQDAADHPAVISGSEKAVRWLLSDLCEARLWEAPEPEPEFAETPSALLLGGRVLLGKGMAEGVEPPEELEPGVLLRGKVHQFYSGPGNGKTMKALYLVARCIERGQKVVFFDMENGLRIVSERLVLLGVDPAKVDEHLVYLPAPNLPLMAEARLAYEALLDEVKPELIVFDSWINFLASAGCDENASNDIARWAVAYTHPARNRGTTVVLLDHVPHDNSHARGSTRKKDEVDVQWKLHCTKPFDRDSVGEIVLHREKDREGWLPPSVRYSVGGGEQGFVFSRSDGTIEESTEGVLTERQKQALDALKVFGHKGARYSEWQRTSGLKGSTFDRAISALLGRGLVKKADGRYFARTDPEPPRGPGVKDGLFAPNAENHHEPPFNPHASNGGSGERNPQYPHTLNGWGYGGNSGGGSDNADPGLTPNQEAEIAKLISKGFSEYAAKAQVLAADHPLDCECEVCL